MLKPCEECDTKRLRLPCPAEPAVSRSWTSVGVGSGVYGGAQGGRTDYIFRGDLIVTAEVEYPPQPPTITFPTDVVQYLPVPPTDAKGFTL